MIQDEQIMLKVQKGNVELLGLLFERYQHELYNFFLKTLSDREASSDLTQTVFLRILKYKKSFKEGQKFRSWMYQIARNARVDHFKASGFLLDMSDVDDLHGDLPDESLGSKQFELETLELIKVAMNKMPVDKREFLTHGLLMDMTIAELADVYGISTNNARVKLHRLIQELKKVYKTIA